MYQRKHSVISGDSLSAFCQEKPHGLCSLQASVRLLINYNKSHKAVVRVSPRVPLELLLPIVCDKCEFREESTILLRDSQSEEPLDLGRSLNELGLREVYARDSAAEAADQGRRSMTPQAGIFHEKTHLLNCKYDAESNNHLEKDGTC